MYATTLTGAILSNTNLTGASFGNSTLTNAKFNGAQVQGADFGYTTGFTFSQLTSTASFQQRNLAGIGLEGNDLTNCDFSGQRLTNASFYSAILTNADFSDADLRGANGWSPALTTITSNTIGPDGTIQGLALTAGEILTIHNYPMLITINTGATLDHASILQLIFDDQPWGSLVQLDPAVTPNLAGTLDLEIAGGVDPATLLNQPIQLFAWNGPLPGGDHFDAITTAPGLTWDTSALYTSGTVTLTAVPEPATLGLLATMMAPFLVRRGKRARS